jgi:hypothetical protein
MSGDNTNPAPEAEGVREAAIALLIELDGQEIPATPHFAALRVAIEALRSALRAERTAQLPIENASLVGDAITRMKAGEQIGTDDVLAIVAAAEVALSSHQSFELRWRADMRAIKRWQAGEPQRDVAELIGAGRALVARYLDAMAGEITQDVALDLGGLVAKLGQALDKLPGSIETPAGERDLIWPDHADLVVWLLELIELRPACPSMAAVEAMVAELDRQSRDFHASAINPNAVNGGAEPAMIRDDPYARGAAMLAELANALIAASRRVVIAESMARFASGGLASAVPALMAPEGEE